MQYRRFSGRIEKHFNRVYRKISLMDTRQKIQRENDIDNEGILLKIKNIGEQYLACRPAREIADAVEALLPDLDEVMLVEVAFQNPTARAFPPHKDYRLTLVLFIIASIYV